MNTALSIFSTITQQRGENIMSFTSGVGKGMFDVSFHNGNASRLMGTGSNSLMNASSSFGLASGASSERASFCANLLSAMEAELNSAQLAMEMDVKYASSGKPQVHSEKDKNRIPFLQKKEAAKKEEQENELEKNAQSAYSEIFNNLKTLSEFNSDAEMRFKTLKEAADNEQVIAQKKYFNYRNTQTGSDNFIQSSKSGTADSGAPKKDKPEDGSNSNSTGSMSANSISRPIFLKA